jgi:hypothetical protein
MTRLPPILQDNRREPVEGETFSSNPTHPFWRVRVRFTTGIKPSLERIRAATAAQALDFVCARYPFASRSGSEVLGRWDPDPTPVDHSHASRSEAEDQSAPAPAPAPTPAPPVAKPPQPAPRTKVTPSLPKFKKLPRDCRGRAIMNPGIIPDVAAAHDGGMSWPAIAKELGCGESTLRHLVLDWRRAQAGAEAPGGEAPATAAPAPEPPAPAVEAPAPAPAAAPEVEAPAPPTEPPATAPAAAPKATDAPEPLSREAIERLHSIREWDVLVSGQVVAQRQPTALADSLTRLLEAAGHRAVAWPSPTPPTPEPTPAPPATVVTTPDGGFLVQVIVKPIQA